MDTFQVIFFILAGFGVLGALLQTLGPASWKAYFTQELDPFFSSVTKSLFGLLVVTALMLLLVRTSRNREGFQNPQNRIAKEFQARLQELKAQEICTVFQSIQKKIFENYKIPEAYKRGEQPVVPTDTEANENTRKLLTEALPAGILNCATLKLFLNPNLTDDTLYGLTSILPDALYVQLYQAIEYSAGEAKKALENFKKSLDATQAERSSNVFETFMDVCSPEVAEERRKFLREQKLTEQQQRCLLPEEVSPIKKDPIMKEKLAKLESEYKSFLASPYGIPPFFLPASQRPSLDAQLAAFYDYKKELDRLQNKAEKGDLQSEIKA